MSTIGFTSTGDDLYDGTYPAAFADEDNDNTWLVFCAALSELLDPIAEITRPDDGSDPWIVLASPWRCPSDWLNVLAQWAGVRRPDVMAEADLRTLIGRGGPGFTRGTKAAMIAAIRRFLPPDTPESLITFIERAGGDPYALTVFTYSFVEHDAALVRQALEQAKPAGLNLDYQVRVGQTWGMLKATSDSWGDVLADYPTWGDVLTAPPTSQEEDLNDDG
jgi:hypothetical protein